MLPTITHIHMSVIPLLAASGTIFLDARAHKTIYDGCQVARSRGAAVRRFRFEDPDHLDELLHAEADRTRLVCMDGVNSMTGNAPDLRAFAEVARRHGALLYVDDAHGFGVIGERAAGEPSPYGLRGNSVVRHVGESYDGIVLVGGFSKAYSSLLAFIACPTEVKQLLKVAAPPYLYSGPSPVASLATVLAGFDVNERRGDELRTRLHALTARLLGGARPARRRDAEPLGPADHRDPAARLHAHRRGRSLPLRARASTSRSPPTRSCRRTRSASASSSRRPTPSRRSIARSRRSRSSPSGASYAARGRRPIGRERRRDRAAVPTRPGVGRLPRARGGPLRALRGGPAVEGQRAADEPDRALAGGRHPRRRPPVPARRRGSPWLLLAAGSALFWLGDLYTYSYPHLLGAEVPFPSPGDALYVAMYPVMMAGLLLLVRRRNAGSDRSGLIDGLILTVGLSLPAWIALMAPYLHMDDLSLVGKAVSVAYPVGDVILVGAVVRLALDAGRREPAFYLLTGSIVLLLFTDFAYGLLTLHGLYDHQLWLDAGWIGSYLLWGAAGLHPSMARLDQPVPGREVVLTRFRLALLTCASLMAPVIGIVHDLRTGDLDYTAVRAASIVLFGLVVVRMAGLVRQQERSLERERLLSGAGAELVAATERAAIDNVAVQAAGALAAPGAAVALCREDAAGSLRVAGVGAGLGAEPGDALPISGVGTEREAVSRIKADEAVALGLPPRIRGCWSFRSRRGAPSRRCCSWRGRPTPRRPSAPRSAPSRPRSRSPSTAPY